MKTIAVDKTDVLNFLQLNLVSEIQAIKKSLDLRNLKSAKNIKMAFGGMQ
ncbi:MAG TPA: hypothetical protein ACFYDZ_04095 [Candidatus Brocadiaceae bacterium]